MEIIIAVSIAVTGWIVNHILSIRAQEKNLKNQIMNNARLEITKAIRDYQDWLGVVVTKVMALPISVATEEKLWPVEWVPISFELSDIFWKGKSQSSWILRLEEYDILFPQFRECRELMAKREQNLFDILQKFNNDLGLNLSPEKANERKAIIEEAQNSTQFFWDEIGLTIDLMNMLQDICLGSITGNEIWERPNRKSTVRLITRKDGKIEIFDPQLKSPPKS